MSCLLVNVFCESLQMLGENAPSQLILYHYSDLKEEKGVVLMTAEMDPKFIVSPAVSACVDLWSSPGGGLELMTVGMLCPH